MTKNNQENILGNTFFLYIYVKFVYTFNRQQCTADIQICNRVLKMKHMSRTNEKNRIANT